MRIPSNSNVAHLAPTSGTTPAERRHPGAPNGLVRSSQDFEAIFLQSLFKSMRSNAIDGGLFEKGNDREIFQDMLDMEVARAAAASNTLGIGRALLEQLQEPLASAEPQAPTSKDLPRE